VMNVMRDARHAGVRSGRSLRKHECVLEPCAERLASSPRHSLNPFSGGAETIDHRPGS
jgi:hypothetical protein